MNLPFSKATLSNGLDVIIHEDRDLPIVAVNIWYHVGSKNERPGRTGFAHLFEHLMFEGSAHYDHGYFPPLQEAGASLNGSTSADRTNYWQVVPTSALDRALWMESDRMGWLLPALTARKLETQRDVVLNERRQSYENRPYGLASLALPAALYPPDHPYHWPTIGDPDDVAAATLDEVAAFFARYYHPGNASLAIAGDIGADEGIALAERYFGGIPRGPDVERLRVDTPAIAEGTRLVLEDSVEFPRIYLAWHSPSLFAAGDAEHDLVADLLANGKTSRLYRTLVFDRRIALDVGAAQSSRELAGYFLISSTAAPGTTLDELASAIDSELARFAETGPADAEMIRARAQAEAQFVYRLQTVGGFGGKSDQLNAYNVYLRDPGFFDADLARYLNAQPADMQRIAVDLVRAPRIALGVVPRGQTTLALRDSRQAGTR